MADKQVEIAISRSRKVLDTLYSVFTVGKQERDFSIAKLVEIGELDSHTNTRSSVAQFKDMGILDRVLEYGAPANGMHPGRHYHLTLLDSKEAAVAKFETWATERRKESEAARAAGNKASADARRGRRMPRKNTSSINGALYPVINAEATVIATETSDAEPVAAISGPESGNTMKAALRAALRESGYTTDESNALVEAAKQYAGRTRKMREKLSELGRIASDMGIGFDLDKVMSAMQFTPDETMELVGLTLPYINRLENTIERQAEQLVEQRRKLAGFDEVRRELSGLRSQNQRLLAEKIGAQNRQAQA